MALVFNIMMKLLSSSLRETKSRRRRW